MQILTYNKKTWNNETEIEKRFYTGCVLGNLITSFIRRLTMCWFCWGYIYILSDNITEFDMKGGEVTLGESHDSTENRYENNNKSLKG